MSTQDAVEVRPRSRSGWDRPRLLLAVVWLGLLLTALLLREERSSLEELYAEVRAGDVERVELVGGLGPRGGSLDGAGGGLGTPPDPLAQGTGSSADLDVRWGRLGDRRAVALVEVAGSGSSVSGDGREVVREDVEAQLRALDPDLQVVRQADGAGVTGSLLGARLPAPLVWVLLGASLATLLLLVRGPQPWRATRWAWFWLLAVPFAALAFCLLSGPAPGVPAPRTDRRLTGGWGFLVGALAGALVTGLLGATA